MSKLISLRRLQDNKVIVMCLSDLLSEINRDRSDEWIDYNEHDWKNGLEWLDTKYEFIEMED